MKAKEVHKLSEEELTIETARLQKRMFELRQQAVTEKIADHSQFTKIRKDVARVLTEASARRIKAAPAAAAKPSTKPASKPATKSKSSAKSSRKAVSK